MLEIIKAILVFVFWAVLVVIISHLLGLEWAERVVEWFLDLIKMTDD